MSKTKENGVVKLSSIQRSGEVQYESESFPITSSVSSQNIDVFLGYRRSLDFDQGDDPGQDFAAVWGGNGGYVVGVVADGVSQSFYGHLAAYRLSESLLNTLWENRANPPSKNELEGELKELEQKVATVVENYQIPEDLVQLHRESLEKTRPQGSQAVFAAFVLDVPNDRLHLYQVGDVDAIVHYPDKPPERIKAPKKGRWSSARKSELHLKVDSYKGASGIAIRSDGAGKDWGESLKDGALDRSAFNLLAKKRAGIDDLSFVAARWGEVLEGEVLEIGPPEAETQRVRRPVRPPHQEETEVLPGTRPYDSDRAPREVAPDTRRYYPEPAMPYSPPRRLSRRADRPGTVPLFAAGVVAAAIIAIALIAVYFFVTRNHPPVANDDSSYVVAENSPLTVRKPQGVLSNDTDSDPDKLTATLVTEPANGQLSLKENGSFTYTPNPGFFGTDSFTYKANDGSDESNPATVSITVNQVNGASSITPPHKKSRPGGQSGDNGGAVGQPQPPEQKGFGLRNGGSYVP